MKIWEPFNAHTMESWIQAHGLSLRVFFQILSKVILKRSSCIAYLKFPKLLKHVSVPYKYIINDQLVTMEDVYIKNLYRILIESYRNSLEDKLTNLKTVRLILLILFLIEILVIYVFIWSPSVTSLNTRVRVFDYTFLFVSYGRRRWCWKWFQSVFWSKLKI